MPRTVKVPPEFEAIFERAEEQFSRFFQNWRRDPTKGTVEVSGERFVLVRGAALSIEFFDFIRRLFGQSEREAVSMASQVLFDLAHALGKADAEHFHRMMGLTDPLSKLSAGPVYFANAGWAFVDLHEQSNPTPDENFYLLHDHPYSFEADAWIRAGRRSDFAVCHMNAGYSSGWCEESFGLPLVTTEISCRAKGDDMCRFIMAPPHRIDGHVERYLGHPLNGTKKIPSEDVWKSFKRDWAREALLERKMRDEEWAYHSLFEILPDAIVTWDGNGVIQTANASAATLLGYERPEDLIGRSWNDFVVPEDRQAPETRLQMSQEPGGISESEFRMQRKDGSRLYVRGRAVVAFDNEGHQLQTIAIARDISDDKEAEEILRERTLHDQLSGLPNRPAFVERLHQAFASSRRGASAFAVIYLDLDRFKEVNDTLGHAVGDRLLQAVAARLKSGVRMTDIAARFGGDEFAVLQTGLRDPADAGVLAAKLLKSIAAPYHIDGNEIQLTASAGVSFYDAEIFDPDALLAQADLALYRAKEDGRDRYRFHSSELDQEVHERVELSNELRAALTNGEMVLHYQPQVELTSGRIVGVEALVRWAHPQRGLLMPETFLHIAERTGNIVALGRWVLERACRQIKEWRNQGLTPPLLAVNVSAIEVNGHPDYERFMMETFRRWDIVPGDVELEFTEPMLMQITRANSEMLEHINDLGPSIAIDDFGMGYSSLSCLSAYPIKRLKIAQQFVLSIPESERDMLITKATLSLAKTLGVDVVAEGVQTKAQLDFLVSAGCTVGQGFYFSEPVSAERMADFLHRGFIEPVAGDKRSFMPGDAGIHG
ncbi:EAL domain-containing protein [Parvibaculum sp.]|uniref:EAL domain-containing protein n=1 Tax=Parvibaculum sp. TaxID=2024848 RepID=UPI00320F94CC